MTTIRNDIFDHFSNIDTNNITNQGLSAAFLFIPREDIQFEDFDYLNSLVQKIMNQLTITGNLQLIDAIKGWHSFFTVVTNKIMANQIFKQDHLLLVEKYDDIIKSLVFKKVLIPSVLAMNVICSVGLLGAMFSMDLIPSGDMVHTITGELINLLSHQSKEVKAASLSGLVHLATSLPSSHTDSLISFVWDYILAQDTNDFHCAFSACKILAFSFGQSELILGSPPREHTSIFLGKYFKDYGSCVNQGAAIGFSILIKELSQEVQANVDKSVLDHIFKYSFKSLQNCDQSTNEIVFNTSTFILSSCEKLFKNDEIEPILKRVFALVSDHVFKKLTRNCLIASQIL